MPRKKKLSPSPVDPVVNPETPVDAKTDQALVPTQLDTHANNNAALAIPEALGPVASSDLPRKPEVEAQSDDKPTLPKGPFWFQTVPLSNETDGPKMRLGRDNRFQQMAIQFDTKPTEDVRQRLHQDGWRWRTAEGLWTKQLEFDRKAQGQLEAERLFDELAKIEQPEHTIAVKQYQRG